MAKYLRVSIDNPCTENWDNMHPASSGRFCDSCQKTVTDFTGMTDAQIMTLFRSSGDSLCGRFYNHQLDRDILIPKKEIPWLKYFFTISIPAFLLTLKSTAQQQETPIALSEKKHIPAEEFISGKIVLHGTVVDEKGQPIEAASVYIIGTRRGTVTDLNGNFRLADITINQQLQISDIRHTTRTVQVSDTNHLYVTLATKNNMDLMGVVVVTVGRSRATKSKKSTALNNAGISLKDTGINSITVFPNPAIASQKISVSWKNKVSGKQMVEIFSANGNLMQKEKFSAWSKLSTVSVELKNLPAGFYIVRVTDLKTNEKFSKEFIVK